MEAAMWQGLEVQRDVDRRCLEQERQVGLRALLIRLAERQFGAMPAEARSREAAADAQTVERWLDRLLTALFIDELIGG